MAAETTPQRAGEGIIFLGRVVGGITGLVAGGYLGIGCWYFFIICMPIFGIAGAIFGAIWGGRVAHALDPMGHGAPRAICRFAAGVLGGVVGGIGCVVVGVLGLVAVVVLAWALFSLGWISLALAVVLLIALAIRDRVRSRRGASEGDTDERGAQVRWPMDQWGGWE